MAGLFSGLFVLGFIFGVPILIMSERWMPLLGSIIRGDSRHLNEDMLESGICEKKRGDWNPPPKPKPIRYIFDNLGRGRQQWPEPEWLEPEFEPIPWTPPPRKKRPKPRSIPRYREREPEMEQLAQELFAELE